METGWRLIPTKAEREQRRGQRTLRKAVHLCGLPWQEETPSSGRAHVSMKHYGRVSFYGQSRRLEISVWTALQINSSRDRLAHQLLIILLQRNAKQSVGRFGLQDTPDGVSIVQTETLLANRTSVQELVGSIHVIMNQSVDLLYQLYAQGLLRRITDWEDQPYDHF